MIWMGYERGVAATWLFSHLVLHQLFPGKLLESARWQHAEKSAFWQLLLAKRQCWFEPLERLIPFLSLLALAFLFHVTTSLSDFSKNWDCDRFFGSSQSCGHGGHVMGEPPAAEIETRGSSQGSDQGMGEIGPKQVQVGMRFFVLGCMLQVIMKSMVTSVMYLPNAFGRTGV